MSKEIGQFECGKREYIIKETEKDIEVYCDGKKVQDKLSYQELLNYMANIIYNESYMRQKAEKKVQQLEKQISEINQF